MLPSAGPAVLGGGQAVEHLLAGGASQSAMRLTPYYNSIQPLHKVYDGFLLNTLGGPFRSDVKAKLIRGNTENEVALLNAVPIRQPDSDTFRSWEITGAGHVGYWFMNYRLGLVARDGLAPMSMKCDKQPLSHVHHGFVLNSAYHHLIDWVRKGKQPPRAEPIQVSSTTPVTLPRDANGHALGGIRLATIDAPTATSTGVNSGESYCRLYGSHEPFPAEKVKALYPTHDAYVKAVREVTHRNVREGFLLEDDAEEVIREAMDSPIGTSTPLPIP